MGPVRREQIVRATIRCLAREGYTRLTMKQVAREAGVSQGILHYYFADKRAMLAATLEAVTRDLDRRVAAAQSRTGRDARARLRALVRACLEVAVSRPEFWVVFVEFWGEMLHDRRLRDLNTAVYSRTRRLIGRLIAEGVRAGRFRPRRPPPRVRGRAGSDRRPVAAADLRSRGVRRGRGRAVLRRRARPLPREGDTMSAEAQAQERARAYFKSKEALAPSEVREQIVAAFEALDAVLATVPPDRAAEHPLPGEWSVQEVVDHLVETYRPGVDELRCVLAGQRPPGEPIPAALQSKAPLLRPWSWLLNELRRAHRDVVELIAGVPADFATAARVPLVMVVNVTGPTARAGLCTGSRRSTGRPTRWRRGGCTRSTT